MTQPLTPKQLAIEAYSLFNRLEGRSNGHAAHGERQAYERVSAISEKALQRYERRYYAIPSPMDCDTP